MIFDDASPSVACTADKEAKLACASTPCGAGAYCAGSTWSHGFVIVPLCVNGRGKFRRSMDLCKCEFQSFQEVRNLCGWFDSFVEYPTVFGAVQLDRVYVLVAKSVEVAATLPFCGAVMSVLDTAWIPFEIPGTAPVKMSAQDQNKLKELVKYSYGRGHFYSDDVDLRLPFPFASLSSSAASSSCGSASGSMEEVLAAFDWSAHLREIFDSASLRAAVSVLLRGYVGERVVPLRGGDALHLLLLGRQNNINPGPRYLSRGLNANHGAGNDLVYEYVMWKSASSAVASHADTRVLYARHTILRGTVPVHWRTDIRVSLSEPVMMFSADPTTIIAGSDTYLVNLLTHLHRRMCIDSPGSTEAQPQLRCISLLRLSAQSGELVLAKHFRAAVARSERAVRQAFPRSVVDLVHMDWLHTVAENDMDRATATFWEAAMGFLAPPAVSNAAASAASSVSALLTTGVLHADGTVTHGQTQTRFVRLNCADSLDRTNLASYFTLLQVSIAMLHALHLPPAAFPAATALAALDSSSESDTERDPHTVVALPDGHPPAIPPPFVTNWTEARDPGHLPPHLARLLGELFVENGDVIARLYTGSAAMHSNALRNMCGLRLSSHNAIIATQRRFENVFEDRAKFRHTEILLGRHRALHFGSLSRVFLVQPVPYAQWACTLLLVNVPPGSTARDVEQALRHMWDERVVPGLLRRRPACALAPSSGALCMTVTMPPEEGGTEEEDVAQAGRPLAGGERGGGDGVECVASSSPTGSGGGGGGGGSVAALYGPIREESGDGAAPGRRTAEMGSETGERVAVVELDPHLCAVIDAPMYFRREGYVSIRGCNCVVSSYSYPVQVAGESGTGVSGAVKTVSTSLKSGIKKLMRNLN